MLIPPKLAALADCASKDTARFQLNGVFVERDADGVAQACATDGKQLIYARWTEADGKEYPAPTNGQRPERADRRPGFKAIIPHAAWAAMGKLLSSKSKNYSKPILDNVLLEETAEPESDPKAVKLEPHRVTLSATNLEEEKSVTVKAVAGTFPDYMRCIEQDEPIVRFRVNPAYLISVVDAVQRCGLDRYNPTVLCEIYDPDRPIAVIAKTPDCEVRGYAMPLIEMSGNGARPRVEVLEERLTLLEKAAEKVRAELGRVRPKPVDAEVARRDAEIDRSMDSGWRRNGEKVRARRTARSAS